MRIGLNLLYLIPGTAGGPETYASELLHSLSQIDQQEEFTVFVNQESSNWPLPKAPNFTRVVCPVSATSRSRRYIFEQLRLATLLKEYRIDILHSLSYVTPLSVPCRSVVSIYDIVYDYPAAIPFAKKQVLRLFVAASAQRSDHILTISEASRHQIVSRLHVQPEKVTVTLLAPKTRKLADERKWPSLVRRLGIRGKYLLAFSSLSPSKNIPMLLQAFARLPAGLAENMQVVVVGHQPQRGTLLREVTDSLGLRDRVVFPGYLSDDDLSLVLKHATVFVFPSLYEGFGIPLLEAMVAGVPVACSDATCLPEVAGDAALLFDPHSPEELVMALKQLLTNPALRDELVSKGYLNLERFSWKTTAEKTLEVHRRVASLRVSKRT